MSFIGLTLALVACDRTTPTTTQSTTPEPVAESESESESEEGFPFEKNTYVSTSHNEGAERPEAVAEAEAVAEVEDPTSGFIVKTPEAAKELAEAAVSEQLDEAKSWKLSPVMPATWPAKDHAVVVFFYPMSSNAGSLTEHQLYSAAFRVTVSLSDGEATVEPIKKRRKLGMIQETRPSSLERRELEMAESALVKQMMGLDPDAGTKPYWGYLKYVHEHPKVGRDLERRSASFFKWLRRKHGR